MNGNDEIPHQLFYSLSERQDGKHFVPTLKIVSICNGFVCETRKELYFNQDITSSKYVIRECKLCKGNRRFVTKFTDFLENPRVHQVWLIKHDPGTTERHFICPYSKGHSIFTNSINPPVDTDHRLQHCTVCPSDHPKYFYEHVFYSIRAFDIAVEKLRIQRIAMHRALNL